MRKATKRVEAEAVDTASTPDASPPKKSKARTKVTREVAPMEARLPRAAKTKVLANNNYVDSAAETMKKSKTRVKPAVKKSNSTEDMSPKSSAGMKKSQSAEDVDPKGREPPAKKGKAAAAKKLAPKKAGATAEVKPRRGTKKDEEHVESEEAEEAKESEDEEPEETVQPPARKTSGKAAAKIPVAGETKEKEVPKKRAATAKKTTRGRGKALAAMDEVEKHDEEEDEETEDVAEEAKPAKGRKGKAIEKAAKPAAKMPRGKKTAPIVDSKEKEANGSEKEIDDVAKDTEEVAKEVKPTKGKKGKASAAPAKMPRGKKAATVVQNKEPEEENDAAEAEEEAESDRETDNDTELERPAQNGTSDSPMITAADDQDSPR